MFLRFARAAVQYVTDSNFVEEGVNQRWRAAAEAVTSAWADFWATSGAKSTSGTVKATTETTNRYSVSGEEFRERQCWRDYVERLFRNDRAKAKNKDTHMKTKVGTNIIMFMNVTTAHHMITSFRACVQRHLSITLCGNEKLLSDILMVGVS